MSDQPVPSCRRLVPGVHAAACAAALMHGTSVPLQLNYPWSAAQIAAIETIGDVALSLDGALVLDLPPELQP